MECTCVSANIQKITFTNTGGYQNPELDKPFADARYSADPAERQKAFSAVQKLLTEQVPEICIQEMAFPTLTDKKLHNLIKLGTGVQASFDDVFLA